MCRINFGHYNKNMTKYHLFAHFIQRHHYHQKLEKVPVKVDLGNDLCLLTRPATTMTLDP